MSRPKVVCLCGSTRFYKEFQKANYDETMKGNIVLSVGFFAHSSEEVHGEKIGASEEQKIMLDELHKRKIDLCDEILVINVNDYIGESTISEINYAHGHGKKIRFLEMHSSKEPKAIFEFCYAHLVDIKNLADEYYDKGEDPDDLCKISQKANNLMNKIKQQLSIMK